MIKVATGLRVTVSPGVLVGKLFGHGKVGPGTPLGTPE